MHPPSSQSKTCANHSSSNSAKPDGQEPAECPGIISSQVTPSVRRESAWAIKRRAEMSRLTVSRSVSAAQMPHAKLASLHLNQESTSEPDEAPSRQETSSNRPGTSPSPKQRKQTQPPPLKSDAHSRKVVGGASNTPLPDTKTHPRIRCLFPVVDTLGLSVESVVYPLLDDAMTRSCNERHEIALGPWRIKAGRLNGYSAYTHIATGTGAFEGIQISIGPPRTMNETPHAKSLRIDVGSEVCWRHAANGGGAFSIAVETLRGIHDNGIIVNIPANNAVAVRRCDVCVDHWGYEWRTEDTDRFACRQSGRGKAGTNRDTDEQPADDTWIFRARKGFTLYVGRRGSAARFLRIYDKIAEAASSGKLPWLMPLWTQAGWDGKSKVWRAEIEHGGEWLRQHGLATMDKLPGCERELWRQYCDDVRHVDIKTDTRLHRCQSSRVWRSLRVAARWRSHGVYRWKPRTPNGEADTTTLLKMATGCLRTAANGLRASFLLPGTGSAPWDASKATNPHVHHAIYEMVSELWDAADAKDREASNSR